MADDSANLMEEFEDWFQSIAESAKEAEDSVSLMSAVAELLGARGVECMEDWLIEETKMRGMDLEVMDAVVSIYGCCDSVVQKKATEVWLDTFQEVGSFQVADRVALAFMRRFSLIREEALPEVKKIREQDQITEGE